MISKTQISITIAMCLIGLTLLQIVNLVDSVENSMQADWDNEIERPAMPIERISGSQCKQNQCLVVGMQAYSEPRCTELGQQGDFCRPVDWADNKTLYYPHKIVEAENIYTLFCPCSKGLECDRATCVQSAKI